MDHHIATFGSGCFWCGQALFKNLKGVEDVVVGYAGGAVPNPTYEQVCSGQTGHAEVFQLTFDPSLISYEQLVEVFFLTHDPTQLNRQGDDTGEQYRSVIFYHNDEQRQIAIRVMNRLTAKKIFSREIVTRILPTKTFFPAAGYHQDYYEKNPAAGYCQTTIDPKIAKFRKKFKKLLKPAG